MPSVRSVSIGIWIGAGSRYEAPGESGVSHFIEHLLFKGSSRHDATAIARIFDTIGGEINALTAREYTMVHARFIDEHLEQAFEVMADMVVNPAFVEVDLEREVVLEEIAMYEDSPGDLVSDYLTQEIFGEHPLGKSVIGTADIIRAITPEHIKDYHHGHYRLPNMVISAAGNVEQERLTELSLEHLAGGNTEEPATVDAGLAPPREESGASFYRKDTQQYHVCFGGLGLSRHSDERYALSILDGILGSSASSRLFQEVREKRGLAYSVYSFDRMYSDTGLVGVYFGCRGDSVAEVTGIVREQVESLIETPVDEEELHRAKQSAKGRILLGLETTHSRMYRLGRLTVTGAEIIPIDEIIERVEAVTADDIQDLARRLYRPESLSAVAIGPDEKVFEKALGLMGSGRELSVRTA
ncbi:MAG: insulinase family protein [Gaiellales bacterium]|nr:MAG: insulinase family protein [Gaiellales bacterium]